jgi:hypothetical protein
MNDIDTIIDDVSPLIDGSDVALLRFMCKKKKIDVDENDTPFILLTKCKNDGKIKINKMNFLVNFFETTTNEPCLRYINYYVKTGVINNNLLNVIEDIDVNVTNGDNKPQQLLSQYEELNKKNQKNLNTIDQTDALKYPKQKVYGDVHDVVINKYKSLDDKKYTLSKTPTRNVANPIGCPSKLTPVKFVEARDGIIRNDDIHYNIYNTIDKNICYDKYIVSNNENVQSKPILKPTLCMRKPPEEPKQIYTGDDPEYYSPIASPISDIYSSDDSEYSYSDSDDDNKHKLNDKVDTKPVAISQAVLNDENNVEGLDVSDLCVICMGAKKVHAYIPCGHKCLCSQCKNNMKSLKCPMCSTMATMIIKIF